MNNSTILITKRNGETQPYDVNKIKRRIETQLNEYANTTWNAWVTKNKVDIDKMVNYIDKNSIVENMTTADIDLAIASYCQNQMIYDEVYEKLAVRILATRLHKRAALTNEEYMKRADLTDDTRKMLSQFFTSDSPDLNVDFSFTYHGYSTLISIYLLKNQGEIIEMPSQLYARVACGLSNNISEAKSLYKSLVNKEISLASPVLFSAGLNNASMISCTLQTNKEDSREGMCDTFSQVAASSSDASGIGLYVGNIRSQHSYIGKSGGKAMGIVRYCKIINELGKGFDQKGKRKGSIAVYNDVYHLDIREFLKLRLPTGQENLRTRDLFLGVNIPDNFYDALLNNREYYLFCPKVLADNGVSFSDKHGKEFEEEYNRAVLLKLGTAVPAKEIWQLILNSLLESGMPYINNIDRANASSNHDVYGKVSSSNLCIEIQQYHDKDTTANCCLGAVVIDQFVNSKGDLDETGLNLAVKSLVYALNKVIDVNKYSTDEARNGAGQRAIAIGMVGLADAFIKMELPYDSDKAMRRGAMLQRAIYLAAVKASHEYSKEYNVVYKDYSKSEYAKGNLHYKRHEFEPEYAYPQVNPSDVHEDYAKQGLANSLLIGNMPTASTSFLLGRNECFEPFTSNIYERENLVGKFVMINPHLRRLIQGFDPKVKEEVIKKIISNGGSVDFDWVPYGFSKEESDKIKEMFRTVWEMSMKRIIDHAATRQPYVDQAQSMNLFLKEPTLGTLSSMLMYSWKKGLKTGIYYLRVKAATETNKRLGIAVNDNTKECLGCSV